MQTYHERIENKKQCQPERICGNCTHWIDTGGTEAGDPSGKCKKLLSGAMGVVDSYDAEIEWLHTQEAFGCNRFKPKDGD